MKGRSNLHTQMRVHEGSSAMQTRAREKNQCLDLVAIRGYGLIGCHLGVVKYQETSG